MNKLYTRIKLKRDTTSNWQSVWTSFIPLKGEMIVFTDYQQEPVYELDEYGKYVLDSEGERIPKTDSEGNIKYKYIPGIKIGDGNSYLVDLPYVDEDTRYILNKHIQDYDMHLRIGERPFWDHKIDVVSMDKDDPTAVSYTIDEETFSENEEGLSGETLVFTRDDWKNFTR